MLIMDPIARKLEVILGSLNAKIHLDQAKSMKDATAVADFFQKIIIRPSV